MLCLTRHRYMFVVILQTLACRLSSILSPIDLHRVCRDIWCDENVPARYLLGGQQGGVIVCGLFI